MEEVGLLLCGNKNTGGIAKSALDQLAMSIVSFSSKALRYLREPKSDESMSFGPFSARVLLENSCAALIARLDCFRMLYLSEFQSQPTYELGKRPRSAFAWTGDVMPHQKAPSVLWHLDHDVDKIDRALFSEYMNHVYWKPAVGTMLDFITTYSNEPILSELLQIPPEKFIDSVRGRGQRLYSTLSKGVHWEFFSSVLILDDLTIKESIRDTCLIIGELGLASHFIPTAYASLQPSEAVDAYVALRRALS